MCSLNAILERVAYLLVNVHDCDYAPHDVTFGCRVGSAAQPSFVATNTNPLHLSLQLEFERVVKKTLDKAEEDN